MSKLRGCVSRGMSGWSKQLLHVSITCKWKILNCRLYKRTSILLSKRKYDKADLGLVHTMPDKFENTTLRAKTEQMFCVHTRAFWVVVYFQNFKMSYSWQCLLFGKINYMTK